MNTGEQIKTFRDFIENIYKDDLVDVVRKGLRYMVIDFQKLVRFSIELSEILLDNPDHAIRAAEMAVKQIDLGHVDEKFRVRFKNLPESQKVLVKDIRAKHLNKFVTINGTIRQKSTVRPEITHARFECPACGNIVTVLQKEKKLKEPTRCSCGRKGKFKLLSKELVDVQGISLEELTTELDGGNQPQRINILLKQDLVSPVNDSRTSPGTNIRVTGIVKEVPIAARDGGQLTRLEIIIEVNHFELLEEDLYHIQVSEDDIREIKKLAKQKNIYSKLVNSLAPGIYGYDKIKEALLLQFVGGVRVLSSDGVPIRGDIHILLIGDPGSGKSQLLKRSQVIAPKARYVSGKGASGAGLTAAVVKNDFMGGWGVEAGALVLCHKGICIIDELDKMSSDDRDAMHEALEQQTVNLDKANIHASFMAETTVLAAANPKFSRFDPYGIVAEQINMPPSLINRFDLIFPIRDVPERDRDENMFDFMASMHNPSDKKEPEIPTPMLRKYLAYARRNCKPVLSQEATDEIKKFWVNLRNPENTDNRTIKSVPINARQAQALIRLSIASAKTRLSNKVTREDAQRAIELVYACLKQVGFDPETKKIDVDRIETGIPASSRQKYHDIKKLIDKLVDEVGNNVPIEDIIKEADSKGIDEAVVEETISRMKRYGDIYEPKRGFIQKI